jgi:hypothetical protein
MDADETQWKWRDGRASGRATCHKSIPDQDILSRPAIAKRAALSASQAAAASAAMMAGSAPIGALAAASSAFAPKTVEPELEAKRKKAEADQAAKVKADEAKVAAARAENCDRAKSQMRSLDSGVRIGRVNAKGEREVLDDKERVDETKRTRDIIAADCK